MNFKKSLAIVAAAGALTALALPAMAETTLYGQARLATFYNFSELNKETSAGGKYSGFDEHLHANARFGIKASDGAVGGQVEYGASGGNANIRLLYGNWNFGSGKLTVGQDYNSYYLFTAQVHGDDNAMNGYGNLWDGRQAQLRVNLNNGLYIAAITPYGNVNAANSATGAAVTNAESSSNIKLYMPKLNVGYAGKAGAFGYNVGVVGQSYKLGKPADKQVTAALAYFQGSAAFGATSLMYNLSYGQNVGNLGFASRMAYDTTNKKNASGFEGLLQATQKISDTVSANAGIGYVTDKSKLSGAKQDNKMLLFVNAPITLAKNVSVTPEFDYYDELKNAAGKKQAKSYAFGAKWQINF
jgi:hypothetical protein